MLAMPLDNPVPQLSLNKGALEDMAHHMMHWSK